MEKRNCGEKKVDVSKRKRFVKIEGGRNRWYWNKLYWHSSGRDSFNNSGEAGGQEGYPSRRQSNWSELREEA